MKMAKTTSSKSIPRAKTPEEVGVSSKAVMDFIADAKEHSMEFHSFMVIRHGKVAAEWYNEPFTNDSKHIMYSASKSFTATAIGFAISEGLLSLDTKLVDLFPEYVKKKDEKLEQITVFSLMTMTAGKQPSLFADKAKADWIETFFKAPWTFEPNTTFLYINENIYMLAAIIKKVTGMGVIDYLMPRLFEPLGIERPFWETDPVHGIEAGGWGLYLSTEDFAKFILCYAQNGKWKNKQVIPKDWVKQATSKQVENAGTSETRDNQAGYGFCFWQNAALPNSYRADGMFSQFGIVAPDYDAVIITTSGISNEPDARECIWRHFPEGFIDESAEEKEEPKTVPIVNSNMDEVVESYRSDLENDIEGRTIKFRKGIPQIVLNLIGFPVSVIPIHVTFMMSDRAGNIDHVKFHFEDKSCDMSWNEGPESNTVTCGMDGHYRYGQIRLGKIDFKVCCYAEWFDGTNLNVTIRPIETVGKRKLNFNFKSHTRVVMKPSSIPDTKDFANYMKGFAGDLIKNPALLAIVKKVVFFLPYIVEPKQRGKFID